MKTNHDNTYIILNYYNVNHSTHQNYNLGGTRLKILRAVKLIWWDFGQAMKATYVTSHSYTKLSSTFCFNPVNTVFSSGAYISWNWLGSLKLVWSSMKVINIIMKKYKLKRYLLLNEKNTLFPSFCSFVCCCCFVFFATDNFTASLAEHSSLHTCINFPLCK